MMDRSDKGIFNPDNLLKELWRNWAVAYGAITLPLLLSLWIPKVLISILTLFEAWFLIAALKSNWSNVVNKCSLVIRIASRIMLATALVMLIIVILCTDWLVPTVIHLELYNEEIPFITSLIVFPVTAVMCVVWLYMGFGDRHCRLCQRLHGVYAGDSIAATFFFRETRYQVYILLLLSLSLGAIEYWYYFAKYINSDLNDPDRFFFNIMPTAVYLVSLLFMYGRYSNMQKLYDALRVEKGDNGNRTIVRYLIFSGDELLLHQGPDGVLDTPAEIVVSRTRSIGEPQARLMFEEITGLSEFDMKYCFTNDSFASGTNVIHYTAFIDETRRTHIGDGDIWFNAYMIDRALASNSLSPVLANEIFRIHTIAMAWKTYDRNGKRLYPIRQYRPTFRFRDLPDWDVDFDDVTWFDVAGNNEDRHFYRLRRFWNRITSVLARSDTQQAQ